MKVRMKNRFRKRQQVRHKKLGTFNAPIATKETAIDALDHLATQVKQTLSPNAPPSISVGKLYFVRVKKLRGGRTTYTKSLFIEPTRTALTWEDDRWSIVVDVAHKYMDGQVKGYLKSESIKIDTWDLEMKGYLKGAGWALSQKRTYENQANQDQLDAATINSLFENDIIPLYYNHNKKGYSEDWIKVVKNSIATIAPHYTMKRQLDDYYDKFYTRQAIRAKKLADNNNSLAKEIAQWKETVAERWDSINVVSKDTSLLDNGGETGVKYSIKYVIDEQGLNDAIGLELVTLKNDKKNDDHQVYAIHQFKMVGHEGNNYTFEAQVEPDEAGAFRSCVRMYPKNENLPHRQDFSYVKWLD